MGFGGKSHRFWNLLLCLEMGEGLVGWGGLKSNLKSVCDVQLRHEKRGIRVIFHFSPISH